MTHRKINPPLVDGFTLIELIIVMVILAISVAVAIPRLGSVFEATSFRLMAKKVVAFLRDARMDSLSSGKKISVSVDLEDFKLMRLADEGEEKDLQMPEGVELSVERDGKDKFKDEKVEFTFYPNGTASGPTLLLEETGKKKTAIIYLEPLAGFVRYKIGNRE